LEEILFLLPVFLPPLLLWATLIFTRDKRIGIRLIWTALVVFLSFPFGLAVIFGPMLWLTYDPSHEHSPGVGVAAAPLLLGWMAAVVAWIIGAIVALARTRSKVQSTR
jgi:hypothetical protein